MGEGSVMCVCRVEQSDSEDELWSEVQEVSQVLLLLLLLLLSLRLRDFDLDLPLLEDLLEDLLLDRDDDRGPLFDATDDKSFLPLIDAGDFGGRWFGAIIFVFLVWRGNV